MSRPVLAALALFLLAVPGADARRCSQVHRSDLAPAKDVKLFEVPNDENGTDLVGCVMPRGGMHLMASSATYEVDSNAYTLLTVKRDKILLQESEDTQYGGITTTSLADIRSELGYGIFRSCHEILSGFCPAPPQAQDSVAALRFNDRGQTAVVYDTGAEHVVVGLSSHSASSVLDRADGTAIDPASLRLHGSTMSWTHAGAQRSFTLGFAFPPYAR